MRATLFLSFVAALSAATLSCSDSDSSSSTPTNVTFKKDIAPIFATNCALAACHASKESPQSFFITYDQTQIYQAILKESPTCQGWKFIAPGQPEASLIMLKMDGQQSKIPEQCTSARRSEMPPGDPPGSNTDLIPQKDRDLLRAWIKAGAKND